MAKTKNYHAYYQSNVPFDVVMEYAPNLLGKLKYKENRKVNYSQASAFESENEVKNRVVFVRKMSYKNVWCSFKRLLSRIAIEDRGASGTGFELTLDTKGKVENHLEEFLLLLQKALKSSGYNDIKIKLISRSSDVTLS